MTSDFEAPRALLARVEGAKGPNIHLDIELWVRLGSAGRRDLEWSDRLPTDPDARCNGLEMGEAIAAGWPAADIRTTWKVPALTSSLDAAMSLAERTLPPIKAFAPGSPPSIGWKINLYRGMTPTGEPYASWECCIRPHAGVEKWHCAPTAALAVLRALLRALVAQAEAPAAR